MDLPVAAHFILLTVNFFSPPAHAQLQGYLFPGWEYKMKCGAAGMVTAKVHPRTNEDDIRVDIYSAGLNVGAKNLRGQQGASIFLVDEKGYRFVWNEPSTGDPQEEFSFRRYRKSYLITQLAPQRPPWSHRVVHRYQSIHGPQHDPVPERPLPA